MNVPQEKQGGNWETGYNKFNDDWFIFVNINTSGKTGHDYNNRFLGNDLEWYAKNRSKLHHPSIQSMLKPTGNIYIFVREDNKNPYFTYIGNGRVKQVFDESPVRIIWSFSDPTENHPEILSEEVVEDSHLYEGAVKQITVNAYERNPIARKKCLEYYGYNCSVCSFNFYEKYGEIGKNFIHVHHFKEMSQIGKEYEIDPIRDLRPVCPNCHAMLHKRKPAYSIEELQQMIIDHNQE